MSGFATAEFFTAVGVAAVATVALVLVTWVVGRAIGRFHRCNVIGTPITRQREKMDLPTYLTALGPP